MGIVADSFFGPGSVGVPLYQAVQRHDRMRQGVEAAETAEGVAPPGWERSIKRMKKKGSIDNPFALAWWLQRTGAHPAKNEDGADAEFDAAVARAVALNRRTGLPKEYHAAAKGEVWAQSMLLDTNLPLLIVEHPWR